MRIKLRDELGYTLHLTDLQECPPAVVWGSSIFLKETNRCCKLVRHFVVGRTQKGSTTISLRGEEGVEICTASVRDCPPALIYESGVYVKKGKRVYHLVRHFVLADTAEVARPLITEEDTVDPTESQRIRNASAVDELSDIEDRIGEAGA